MNWKGKQTLFVHLTAASAWIKSPPKYTRTVYSKHKYLLSFLFWHNLTKQQNMVLMN